MKHLITTVVPIEIAESFIETATAGAGARLGCLPVEDQCALRAIAAAILASAAIVTCPPSVALLAMMTRSPI